MPTALAIAKTAWFVLCLISCFANNLIVLLSIYFCLSTFQMSHSETSVSSSLRCRFVYFSAFCRFSTPFTGKPRRWGLSYKVFWRSFFTQTVWVKNKLCLLKTRQRRPKNRNVCFSFQPTHISGSIWISTQLDFDDIRLLFGDHTSRACN